MSAVPPLVDSHLHLWQRERTPQPWIDPATMAVIDRDFWIDDLVSAHSQAALSVGSRVVGCVLVQSAHSTHETCDLLAAAEVIEGGGVVGWVDLHESGAADVADQVGQLRGSLGGDRLRGIRHLVHQDPDPHWLTHERTRAGFAALERFDLPFDLVVQPTQLPDVNEAVRRSPGTRFVLDHLGKPPIASGDLGAWARNIRELAQAPNVVAKLSGLTTEASWLEWARDDLEPVIDLALETFGPDRLMFGSDWPVVELSGGGDSWLRASDQLLGGLSDSERAAIYSGTANDFYALDA